MKSILITTLSAWAICLSALTAQAREWTSTDGRKIEAQFISARDGKVTIQRTNGKRYTLSLEKLSEADQKWVEEKLAGTEKTEEKSSLGSAPAKSNEYTKQLTGKWERLEDDGLKYRLFGERKLKGSKLFPLVVYLHGRGGDVMTPEVPWSADSFAKAENYRKRPCFVIAPQCPTDQFWSGTNAGAVVEMIDKLVKNLPVDKDRIYLTGYSMGGFGTFTLLAQEPKLFAAAAPIAGGGNPSSAGQFKKVPVWVFHGSDDEIVKVDQSRNMVEALKKARAPVQYTEMAGEGHGIAGKVYDDTKFHEWMFEQTNGKKEKP